MARKFERKSSDSIHPSAEFDGGYSGVLLHRLQLLERLKSYGVVVSLKFRIIATCCCNSNLLLATPGWAHAIAFFRLIFNWISSRLETSLLTLLTINKTQKEISGAFQHPIIRRSIFPLKGNGAGQFTHQFLRWMIMNHVSFLNLSQMSSAAEFI